jgi:uncharacterized protein
MNFKDRYGPWAIVTGASSGIGEHFADLLADRGLNLIVTARRRDRLDLLATSLKLKYRIEVKVLELDLTSPNFIGVLLQATDDKDVGLVVSNAGFGFKGLHHLQDRARLVDLVHVNALAPTLIGHAFAPSLIKRGKGGIIITGSVEGFFSSPWSAAYAASKAFVHSLGEALWGELRHDGVDVVVLAPGATDTENLRAQGFDANQMRNVMQPRRVAELALTGLESGPVIVAGGVNRIMVGILGLIPKRSRIGMVGKGTKAAMDKAAGR